MIEVNNYATFTDAVEAFAAEAKPILRDVQRRTHFTPDRAKQHKRAKSAGGGNRQRDGRKPRGKR